MFLNYYKSKFKSLNLVSKSLFGSHGPAVKGRIKVSDKIIWINVRNNQGEFQRIASYEGESMMRALKRGHAKGMTAQCNGGDPLFPSHLLPHDYYTEGPYCNQCKVVMGEEDSQKIFMGSNEQKLLANDPHPISKDHRLA